MKILDLVIFLAFYFCVVPVLVEANQRQVLMKVAKDLSESLENMIIKTDKDISQIRSGQETLKSNVESLESRLDKSQDSSSTLQKLDDLEHSFSVLQANRQIDLKFFEYSNLVYNASLEMLEQNLTAQILQVNSSLSKTCDKTLDEELFNMRNISEKEDSSDATKDTLNNLDSLQDLLNYYDYDYDYEKSIPKDVKQESTDLGISSVESPGWKNSIPDLLNMTHHFMINLNNKFLLSTKQISEFTKEIKDITKQVKSKLNKSEVEKELEVESELRKQTFDKLQNLFKDSQLLFRNELDLKAEDIDLMKKLTDSRLSIYEKRIDILESMVLNLTDISSSSSDSLENNMKGDTFQYSSSKDDDNSMLLISSTENDVADRVTQSTTTALPRKLEFSVADDLDRLAAGLSNNRFAASPSNDRLEAGLADDRLAARLSNDRLGSVLSNDRLLDGLSRDQGFNEFDEYYYERSDDVGKRQGSWPGSGPGLAGGSGQGSGPGLAGGSGPGSGPGLAGGSWPGSGPGLAGGSWLGSGPGLAGGSWPGSGPGLAGGSGPGTGPGLAGGSGPGLAEGSWPVPGLGPGPAGGSGPGPAGIQKTSIPNSQLDNTQTYDPYKHQTDASIKNSNEPFQANNNKREVEESSCDCKDIQTRLSVLESSFGTMISEVESQMAGIQASITKMVHRVQFIEGSMGLVDGGQGKRTCKSIVLNKSTASLRGMDDWCDENCLQGNCPKDLCYCL